MLKIHSGCRISPVNKFILPQIVMEMKQNVILKMTFFTSKLYLNFYVSTFSSPINLVIRQRMFTLYISLLFFNLEKWISKLNTQEQNSEKNNIINNWMSICFLAPLKVMNESIFSGKIVYFLAQSVSSTWAWQSEGMCWTCERDFTSCVNNKVDNVSEDDKEGKRWSHKQQRDLKLDF